MLTLLQGRPLKLTWLALPEEMTLRIVRGSCYVKGFRIRRLTLVTTLLDPQRYPAQEPRPTRNFPKAPAGS